MSTDVKYIGYETKIWGGVRHLWTPKASVSILDVNAGFRCSRHYHRFRFNKFHVISGVIDVIKFRDANDLEGSAYPVYPGGSIIIPPNRIHEFRVIESGVVVETYWTNNGTEVDMNDIVRFDQGGQI